MIAESILGVGPAQAASVQDATAEHLIEAFEERAVDGYMLFGRGKESVASLASLEAWGADDPDTLRTDLIKVRLVAEGLSLIHI